MHARLVIIAVAFFGAGSAFSAEPARPPAHESVQPEPQRAQIVLASAEQVNPGPTQQQAQPTVRRARVARVTTCRCGDQQAEPDE
jgi:predicted component of type VI protein secretion system